MTSTVHLCCATNFRWLVLVHIQKRIMLRPRCLYISIDLAIERIHHQCSKKCNGEMRKWAELYSPDCCSAAAASHMHNNALRPSPTPCATAQ